MQSSFAYNDHTLPALVRAISRPRLEKYEEATRGDLAEALRLYRWNTSLCESLYGPLQSLEIALRNAIHERLSAAFSESWYDHPGAALRPTLQAKVQVVRRSLSVRRKPLDPARIVSELGFGFWVDLFGSKYENALWRAHLRHIFVNAPSPLLRSTVHAMLENLRGLRNRIAHHEPILNRPLERECLELFTLLSWLCRVMSDWTAHFSRFDAVFQARPRTVDAAGALIPA